MNPLDNCRHCNYRDLMTVGDQVRFMDRVGDVPEGSVGEIRGFYRRDDLLVLVALPDERAVTVPATSVSVLDADSRPRSSDGEI